MSRGQTAIFPIGQTRMFLPFPLWLGSLLLLLGRLLGRLSSGRLPSGLRGLLLLWLRLRLWFGLGLRFRFRFRLGFGLRLGFRLGFGPRRLGRRSGGRGGRFRWCGLRQWLLDCHTFLFYHSLGGIALPGVQIARRWIDVEEIIFSAHYLSPYAGGRGPPASSRET